MIEIDPLLRHHIESIVSPPYDSPEWSNRWNVRIHDFDLKYLNLCNTGSATHSKSTLSLAPLFNRERSPSKEIVKECIVIDSDYNVLLKHCMPREVKDVQLTNMKRTRTPWRVELSLFREYFREDREELHSECFEFDWQNVKQLKYKKSTEDEVKLVAKSAYRAIKDLYKAQSGYGKIGNIFSVALNQYTEFLKEDLNVFDLAHL